MTTDNADAKDSPSVQLYWNLFYIGFALIGVGYAVLSLADIIYYPWMSVVIILVSTGLVAYKSYQAR